MTSFSTLRTPDERFAALPDWPYAPQYRDDLPGFARLRTHYIDVAGDPNAPVFLCLHGQPTWAYLYRRMIPIFAATGARVVAPDFFGFGRSDKPDDEAFYTFDMHRRMLVAFNDALDLRNITLVVQDWGGLLGLTLPLVAPSRFKRLVVMNTMLATGDAPLSAGFVAWRAWANANPDMPVGKLMRRTCPHLTDAEVAAYEAPFPDARHKAGVRQFPNLVPERIDDAGAAISRQARDWWRTDWRGPTFMAVGATDPVLGPPVMRDLARTIHGCPEPYLLPNAGHFAQEWGGEIAERALGAFAASV